ncbi:Thioredoxin domain-containing protein 12-like [Homarus americanus]|uniref:Thioredoxin domain-containing protein 12-like n=1 Tax=Homarus americanus TaxID=6706 RepID=A0A8J5JKP7_HOMAM|nr:Thioredoxin domain-containing protein 12-like [Homarus americanus]
MDNKLAICISVFLFLILGVKTDAEDDLGKGLDSQGEVHQELYNKNGNPKYKFFYFDDETVITSMKEALEVLGSRSTKSDEL